MSRTFRVFLVVVCLVGTSSGLHAQAIWVIGHMSDSEEAVQWVADNGANGVEIDLQFDSSGNPTVFQHGAVCDCSCLISYGVCSHLGRYPCINSVAAGTLLNKIASTQGLGLVVIDSKVSSSTDAAAGDNVVQLVENELFGRGYMGNVVISVSKMEQASYIERAAAAAVKAAHASHIYFTFDEEGDDVGGVVSKLTTLASPNRVYGTGESACSPSKFYDATLMGKMNENAGVVALNYIWTLDKTSSVETYLRKGADGIMTNAVDKIVPYVKSKGYTLATAGTPLKTITSSTAIGNAPSCDCNYHPGGCSISSAAPPNFACDCTYKGAWTCAGKVVTCLDPSGQACKSPSTSIESCAQGGGDCGGYKNVKCDCDYHRGGCSISTAAPADTACKCIYKGAWTCGGDIVPCKNFADAACKNPGTDKASCDEGGGDCGAYK